MAKRVIWGILLIPFCIVLAAACSSKEEKIAGFISKGDRLLSQGDAVRAVLEYKNALQIDPKSAKAMTCLAGAYLAQQDFQKAYSGYRSVLDLDPGADEARIKVAWLLAMGNQNQGAMDELEKIKDPEKFQPNFDLIKAKALFNLQRYGEVVDLLRGREDDKDKNVHMLLSQSLKALGSFDQMKHSVGKWREADKLDPASYVFMALFFAEQGKKDEIARELEEMTNENPDDGKIKIIRAQCLEQLGLVKEAESAFEQLPETPDMLTIRADFWIRRGNLDNARAMLRKVLTVSPGDLIATLKLAQVLAAGREMSASLDLLDRYLKQDLKKPDRAQALLAKATLKAGMNELGEARHICESVLQDNQANLDAHLLLGKILLSSRSPQEAEIHLNQVILARPGDEDVNLLLAHCLLLNKKDSMAGDVLKRAVETNPDSEKIRLALVRFYFGKNDMEQALRVLDKGLERQPKNALLLRTRGELRVAGKDYALAEQDFRKLVEFYPQLPLGYMEMGHMMLAKSQAAEAVGFFRKALELENGWPDALPSLIATELNMGRKDLALSIARTETQKHPDAGLAQYILGQTILAAGGDIQEAERALLRATEIAPLWPETYRILAEVYSRQGKLDEVIANLAAEYHNKQSSAPLCQQLAIFQEYRGNYREAIQYYSDLVKQTGRSPVILNNLAYLYAEHDGSPDALQKAGALISQALAGQPDNASFLDTAAWVAYKQGNLVPAWDYVQNAVLNTPENPIHNLHAAIILKELGRKEDAMVYLDKSIQQNMDRNTSRKAADLKAEWVATEQK